MQLEIFWDNILDSSNHDYEQENNQINPLITNQELFIQKQFMIHENWNILSFKSDDGSILVQYNSNENKQFIGKGQSQKKQNLKKRQKNVLMIELSKSHQQEYVKVKRGKKNQTNKLLRYYNGRLSQIIRFGLLENEISQQQFANITALTSKKYLSFTSFRSFMEILSPNANQIFKKSVRSNQFVKKCMTFQKDLKIGHRILMIKYSNKFQQCIQKTDSARWKE